MVSHRADEVSGGTSAAPGSIPTQRTRRVHVTPPQRQRLRRFQARRHKNFHFEPYEDATRTSTTNVSKMFEKEVTSHFESSVSSLSQDKSHEYQVKVPKRRAFYEC